MKVVILDCYTDEASGLGVPPYLGTYPRYLFGRLKSVGDDVKYITIDDLRLHTHFDGVVKEVSVKQKTNIFTYNLTTNNANDVIAGCDKLIVILGVHVPGKYLSAHPGTLKEVIKLIKNYKCEKVLSGPALFGTQLEGGKFFEKQDLSIFNEVKNYSDKFEEIEKFIDKSYDILKQIPDRRVIEIETGRGCKVGKCSFCTEPLKNRFVNRKMESVVEEVVGYYKKGARFFRLGKQADFYASDRPIEMLKQIRSKCKNIEVLHIDNVNPNSVISKNGEEITKAIVEYCTPGNIAAFGVESFDIEVVKTNRLNTSPAVAMKAIRIINKYGAQVGSNGMHKFLPGINIIFGLLNESKNTHKENMKYLNQIMDEGLLLRRINIRQAAILPDTFLEKHGGNKYLRKNKHLYWKWRNEIRQKIDLPMLGLILPIGQVLSDVYTEIYDGKTTFARHYGTYPIAIGIKERLPLKEKIKVKVVSHMLRSIVAKKVD
jgi:radical SAM superfamily enzyme with C-terminal helix-hairpin-helix motif